MKHMIVHILFFSIMNRSTWLQIVTVERKSFRRIRTKFIKYRNEWMVDDYLFSARFFFIVNQHYF